MAIFLNRYTKDSVAAKSKKWRAVFEYFVATKERRLKCKIRFEKSSVIAPNTDLPRRTTVNDKSVGRWLPKMCLLFRIKSLHNLVKLSSLLNWHKNCPFAAPY